MVTKKSINKAQYQGGNRTFLDGKFRAKEVTVKQGPKKPVDASGQRFRRGFGL